MFDFNLLVSLIAACAAICGVGILCVVFRKQTIIYRSLEARLSKIEGPVLDNFFSQLEALGNLHKDLDLKSSLPKTRGWAACPDFLYIIADHALRARPEVIMECGSGVSTIVLAQCMALNGYGHVFSLEHDREFAEMTREHIARRALQRFATVLDAPLKVYVIGDREFRWYDLSCFNVSNIHMLVIDGPPQSICKMARYPAGAFLFSKMIEGAYIFLDDAARGDEKAIIDLWSRLENVSIIEKLLRTEKGCAILVKTAVGIKRSL